MRLDRTPGSPPQPRLKPDIEPLDDCVDMPAAGGQTVKDAGLALVPVGNEGTDMSLRFGDCRPVGRPINRLRAAQQFVE